MTHRKWRTKMRFIDSGLVGIERQLCGLPVFRIPASDIEATLERLNKKPPPPETSDA